MAFPITRFRVKSEWPKLIGVAACVLLLLWATVFTVSTPSTYKQYADYAGVSSGRADSGLEGPGSTVAEEEYQRYLAEHRDFLFSKSVEGSAFYVYLSALALAMLLVCAPLQRGTAGLWIGAGASRGKVFAALGLGFLLPLLLVGGVAFAALREHFNLRYTGEELAWFRLAGYSWFLILLACGAVPFLFSFVFGKGLPAGLCSLAAWFLLGLLPGAREVSPFGILRRAENWLPEAGEKALLTADAAAGALVLLALIAGWFCFRRRELGGVKKHREAPKHRAAGPEKPVPHYREKPGLMDQAMNVYWMRSGNVLNENKAIRGGSGKKNLLFVVIALLFGLLIVGIPILYVQLRWGG